MGLFREIFSLKNAVRGSGVVGIAVGLPLIFVPAVVIDKLFNGTYSDPKHDVVTKTGARSAGIATTVTGVLSIAKPSLSILHVKMIETVAALGLVLFNRVRKAEENPEINRRNLNILITVYSAGLIFLILSRNNDEPKRGQTWQEMLRLGQEFDAAFK